MTKLEKRISNFIHPYRIGVWDGFYYNEPRTAKYVGKRKLVANCIYRLGLSFGDFLRQTHDEMYEEDY